MNGEVTPFVLPGPPLARNTLAGWDAYRRTRKSFAPAPVLDRDAWQALSRRRRQIHDLHRAATHANLPVLSTPMSRAVGKLLTSRIETNALKQQPTTRAGVMVTGGGYQGKTESVCEIIATFEDRWRELLGHVNSEALAGTRDLHAPVAYVQTPVTAKPKSLCKAILSFYDAPFHVKLDLPELIRLVADCLHDHGTKVLILDDITRLRMHRADDQDTLDLIRAFMSMHVTLVLVGVNIQASGLLREGLRDAATGQWTLASASARRVNGLEATQTERRFDLVELGPFRYGSSADIAAWVRHLTGIENALCLLDARPGMLSTGTMPEYLYERTGGVVGLLERLIEDGCREAMDCGQEHLTEALLDTIAIDLDGSPARDVGAGEVPPVPSRKRAVAKRGRNTVDSLAEEIPRTSPINYRQRREAVLNWELPANTWHDLLKRTSMPRAQRDIAADDGKRLSCSIYIWAQVTKGEQRFAPCPPGARSDPGRHYLTRGSSAGYTALKRTLDTHAKHLSAGIDASRDTVVGPGGYTHSY